jgi:LacI family transcriptional regulator
MILMKKVLIIVDTSRLTGRDLLSGAEKYISTFAHWEVYTLDPNYLSDDFSKEVQRMDLGKFDGFFVCYTKNISSILKTKKPKIIHCTPKEMLAGTSLIVTHSSKIGAVAADYFISLGFKNFAYCGFKDIIWSDQRCKSYQEMLHRSGFEDVKIFIDTPRSTKDTGQKKLTTWLKKLPKPICIFACNDDRAIYILEACKSSHINVPEEVAVLGVDNDELVCNLSSPPLSSIALDFKKTGFLAAKYLDQLMNQKIKDTILEVDPVEIITRKSTDIFAVDDEELVAAMVFIRNNYHKPIQISDVVEATSISRRELHDRFKAEFNKTIKNEIERFRIDHIKRKLIHSREPVYKIANTLEFTDPEHFSRYFKNLTGMTPSEFRQGRNSL